MSNYNTLNQAITAHPMNDTILDTVQEIKFGNPQVFAAGCWDGTIRFYEIQFVNGYRPQLSVDLKKTIDCQEPVLSISWKPDCSMIFAALADNTIRAYDVGTGQSVILGMHDNCPARNIFWNEDIGVLVSFGMDKNLRLWQLSAPQFSQQPKPVFELQLSQIPTVADQDINNKYLAYCDLETRVKWLEIEKLRGTNINMIGKSPFMSEDSRLSKDSQLSSLIISSQTKMLGYGSVDGRVCVLDMNQRHELTSKLVYKCCKTDEESRSYRSDKVSKYYCVNGLQFNCRGGAGDWVCSAGSDGQLTFWDIYRKQKIVNLSYDKIPVTSCQVSPDGYFVAYALGYDWSKGIDGVGEYGARMCVTAIEEKHLHYSAY